MTARRFAAASWFLLGYTVLVILWGALVRATGAGAGCGSHWPLCNGEVLPRAPSFETLIEFSHRLSSGLLGILVVGLVVAAFRTFPRGHAARKGALWSLFFVGAEALIGAGLVRFEWVAANVSQERVYVMAFHLANTFLLLGVMTLTAWLAGGRSLRLRARKEVTGPLALALLSVLVVGASGAVTALGDTLVFGAGISPEDSPVVARLVASRFYHPTLAFVSFAVLAAVVLWIRHRVSVRASRLAVAGLGLYAFQLVLGGVNVLLMAPVWMQLVHLAVSDVLWILLILVAAEALARGESAAAAA